MSHVRTNQQAAADSAGGHSRWWVLVVIAVAQLMIVLDATIMNIALPSAQADLGLAITDRQWVVTAYALAFGSLLLLGGRLADLIGRRRMFLLGLAGFAAASALGGASTSFGMLITARAGQGAFAAMLAPAALSLLATTFTHPNERGRAFGVYGAVAGAGGAVGLLLGGLLTEYLSWRWCLYVNVIIAGVAAIGGALLLRTDAGGQRSKLDIPGAMLVSGGMFCLVYGLSNAGTHDWGTPSTWGFLLAGLIVLAVFVWWQTRASAPLLPLRILADRNRGGAYLSMLLAGAGMFGIMLFLNFFLQQNLGYSPVQTGLAFLPMVILTMALNTISAMRLMPKFGPRPLVTAGMLLAAVGSGYLTRIDVSSGYLTHVLPAVLLAGAGLGLIFAPVVTTGTDGVPWRDTGVASATVNAGNQLGGSIGTALLNTIFASAVATFIADQTAAATTPAVTGGTPGGSGAQGPPDPVLIASALVHGYSVAFWWSAGIFLLGAVLAALILRSGPLAGDGEGGWGHGTAQGTGSAGAAAGDGMHAADPTSKGTWRSTDGAAHAADL